MEGGGRGSSVNSLLLKTWLFFSFFWSLCLLLCVFCLCLCVCRWSVQLCPSSPQRKPTWCCCHQNMRASVPSGRSGLARSTAWRVCVVVCLFLSLCMCVHACLLSALQLLPTMLGFSEYIVFLPLVRWYNAESLQWKCQHLSLSWRWGTMVLEQHLNKTFC